MRRPIKRKNILSPDSKFHSLKVARFINVVMWDGKKTIAEDAVYAAFNIIATKIEGQTPVEVFDAAIKNSSPLTEVRSRRIGGANYQVPREVRPERRLQLSMRWIIDAARKIKGKPIAEKLAAEIIAASKGEGAAVRQKENTHKMAEANKAFAHFSW